MRTRESGMTAIGLVIALAIGGLILFAGLRLGPVYIEHMKVISAMEKVVSEFSGKSATVPEVRNALGKRYDIESISHPSLKDIKIVKEGSGIRMVATYDHVVPYLGNISFMVSFDDYMDIPR